MWTLVAILWFAVPAYVLGQALYGLWLRWQLMRDPIRLEAQVIEVKASHVERLEDATVVDLIARFPAGERNYEHTLTRTDHRRRQYGVGSVVELMHAQGNPANVIDADGSHWNDVIGPIVFGLLLLLFMAWAGPFLAGLTRSTGLI